MHGGINRSRLAKAPTLQDNCTIEDGVLIGIGRDRHEWVRIGKGCVVSAAAIVTEEKEFSERSLIIGAPARLKKIG